MEPTTRALLRNAILEAVTAEQDSAALELLQLLNGTTAATPASTCCTQPARRP